MTEGPPRPPPGGAPFCGADRCESWFYLSFGSGGSCHQNVAQTQFGISLVVTCIPARIRCLPTEFERDSRLQNLDLAGSNDPNWGNHGSSAVRWYQPRSISVQCSGAEFSHKWGQQFGCELRRFHDARRYCHRGTALNAVSSRLYYRERRGTKNRKLSRSGR